MAKYTKRRDKRGYEWKSAYREKEALMLERGYPEVSPHDFYRELFPTGSLQQEPGDGKGNIIATQIRPSGKGRTRQWVIDDSLKMLDKVIGDRFGLIPPISFYGKSHTKENAHELFAVVVDVDYVGKQQLKNLLKQFGNGVQLRPTYLVSSGKGVHLYYFLQEPVQLYRNREEVLAELKEAFIRRLWNDTSSIRPDSPDITGIYQGFRCVGSQSKLGADFPVKAYKLSENRYTLEDIKASIPSCKVDLAPLYEKPRRKSTVTLEEAKELYPEWYEKRIVQGEPKQKSKKQGGTWVCNEALYEWWKRKITEEVKAGGRYFSIMALCSYGLKCGISEQKIRRDAYAFLDHLESLTEDEDNHFSRADVKDALRALKGDRKRLSTIASREWIEDNTKVTIPANKRNYRKQEAHLYLARRKKEDMKVIGEVVKEGRPTAERTVREWQESHPAGKKADCIRETGLAKHTVYKWWKYGILEMPKGICYNANRQERRKCSLWHAKSPGVATSGAFLFRCGKVAYALGWLPPIYLRPAICRCSRRLHLPRQRVRKTKIYSWWHTPFLYLYRGGSVAHYTIVAEMPQEAISPCLLSKP